METRHRVGDIIW